MKKVYDIFVNKIVNCIYPHIKTPAVNISKQLVNVNL